MVQSTAPGTHEGFSMKYRVSSARFISDDSLAHRMLIINTSDSLWAYDPGPPSHHPSFRIAYPREPVAQATGFFFFLARARSKIAVLERRRFAVSLLV
jgi:hypothetical protein